ncbi:ICOS ligand-like [Erpetoichthys calabaricus]|uniref:ICOS ligand-like n=1 Tax=Erpetoichthys calabaricus TaxID=27687 RepID=UPI002234CDB2|nr:ICOS ligand-like [Erpetoichthys calabaricus]
MACIWMKLCPLLLSLVHVSGDDCLTAIFGETVQIPCSLNTTESLKAEDISVEWTTSEGHIVHSFVKGEDKLEHQDLRFRGRTQLFTSELSRGNLSLSLSNVLFADEGEFKCSYYDSRIRDDNSKPQSKHCLLVAGRYSVPYVTRSSSASKNSEVNFTCKAAGGYPEPKVHWSVNKELFQESSRVNTRKSKDSKGLYSVTSVLTLTVTGNVSVTCIIENERLEKNETSVEFQYLTQSAKEAGIPLVPVVVVLSAATVLITLVLIIILMKMMKKKKSMTQNASREDDDIQAPLRQGPDN